MNREWSELKKMQILMKKEDTFDKGIKVLLYLRDELFDEILGFKKELSHEAFSAIPFINAKGYHSKTVAYSLWHIFRIEDIVLSTLIEKKEQIFFSGNYDNNIRSSIITTGNELSEQQIADFSRSLDIGRLYEYISEVKNATDSMLQKLSFADIKRKMTEDDKRRLELTETVSRDENAVWLIDYWCGKDVRGLIQMPFSRHWIMHIEASIRIKNKVR